MTRHTKESLQQPEKQDAVDTQAPDSHSAQRRRLLRAGLTSSVLLTTVTSRPAWANGGMCTASAVASANASGGYNFEGCGISAGWWKNSKHLWPVSHTTAFHTIFAPVKYKGKVLYNGFSLGDVINLNGGNDPVSGSFGFHLIGAYLNALTFPPNDGTPGYAFTPQQIVDSFNALLGVDTRTEGGTEKSKKPGGDSSGVDAMFASLASTLEYANNQFDSTTDKPDF